MTYRRLFFARLIAATTLGTALAAHAWTWSWNWGSGPGERVQGSGELATETRLPGAFDAIAVVGPFNVRVRQSATESVQIRAESNLLPLIETRVVGDGGKRVLEIGVKRGFSLQTRHTPVLTVDARTLRSLALSGSGDVQVEPLKTDRFDARLSGSGDLSLADLQAASVALSVAGSGDVVASGRAESLTISIAGSGDVQAAQLEAGEVKVSVAGSGDVQVHATQRLKVSVAGSGDVRYRGSPQVDSSIAGSGSVRRLASGS